MLSSPASRDDALWSAVVARDAAADGAFFYAVRTTGVYCRPSCAARRPNRENVAFYPSGRAAERAGFRACKRCRPNEPARARAAARAIAKACALLERADETPTLGALAVEVGLSPFHFQRLFKKHVGATPRDYARARQLARFGAELDAGRPIAAAVYSARYGSSSRAYEAAERGLGMTPRARAVGQACAKNPVALLARERRR